MKIVHLHKGYPPQIGGIEFHIQALAQAQARVGHHVTVLCCNSACRTQVEEENGVRVIRVARWGRVSSLPIGPSTGRWLRRLPADVIHVHTPYPLGEWIAGSLPEDRTLIGSWHSDIVRQRTLGWLFGPWQRRFLVRCNRIVVATPQHVTSSRVLPPYAEKTRVVHYGIDTASFAAPAPLPVDLPRPFVLFVGRLVRYKGVEVLLDAWRAVQDAVLHDHPSAVPRQVWLVCVGEGPLAKPLRHRATELGIAPAVRWLPHVEQVVLRALYQAAEMLVLPSVSNNEAFGLVQLEAMAAGCPVVSTRLPTGVSYVNRHRETGLLAEPGDAASLAAHILTLLTRPELRTAYGNAGRERVQREFTVAQMLAGTDQVYAEALQTGG